MMRKNYDLRLWTILLLLAGWMVTGCESEPNSPIATTPGAVAENMEQYRDSLVTVSGEVYDIYLYDVQGEPSGN